MFFLYLLLKGWKFCTISTNRVGVMVKERAMSLLKYPRKLKGESGQRFILGPQKRMLFSPNWLHLVRDACLCWKGQALMVRYVVLVRTQLHLCFFFNSVPFFVYHVCLIFFLSYISYLAINATKRLKKERVKVVEFVQIYGGRKAKNSAWEV